MKELDDDFNEQVGIGMAMVTTTRVEYGGWSVHTRDSGRKYYHPSML
jgi:hypothetical protein